MVVPVPRARTSDRGVWRGDHNSCFGLVEFMSLGKFVAASAGEPTWGIGAGSTEAHTDFWESFW